MSIVHFNVAAIFSGSPYIWPYYHDNVVYGVFLTNTQLSNFVRVTTSCILLLSTARRTSRHQVGGSNGSIGGIGTHSQSFATCVVVRQPARLWGRVGRSVIGP